MTIIRDPLLEPYFIGKDAYCYTAYEVITPQKKYLEKGSLGKDYEKPIGHYKDFGNALEAIMKHQLNETPIHSLERRTKQQRRKYETSRESRQ